MLRAVSGTRDGGRATAADWRVRVRGWLLALLSLASAPALAVDIQVSDLSDTGSDPTPAGGVVTYSITIQNSDADVAEDTYVLFDLPPGTSAASLPPFCTANAAVPTRIECDMGSLEGVLAGGDPVTFQIQVDTGGVPPGLITIDAAVGQAPLPDPTIPLDSLPDSDPFFAGDANTADNRASQSTTLIESADLEMNKSASPNPVVAGGIVTFTIAVTNNGPSDATNFSVTDTLPAGLVFIDGSASGTGWTFSGPNGTFPGTLPAGQTATYTFQAQATASSGSVVNSALVTAGDTPDPDTSNNVDDVSVGINEGADLNIGKTVTPAPATAGETVTFTVVVENEGPGDADNVSFTDPMPPGFVITGGNEPAGWTCTTGPLGGQRTCTHNGPYTAGSSDTFTIEATVPTSGPGSGGDQTNTATVTSDTPDPEPGNNSGSATFTVLTPGADLALNKDKQPPLVNVWDGTEPDLDSQMTTTINVTNQGPDTVTGQLVVVDTLAPGEQYLGAGPTPPWTCTAAPPVYIGPGTPQVVTCTLDASALPLASGASAPPLTIITRAREPGTLTNTACTGGSGGSPEPITGGGTNVDGNPGNDCSGDGSGSTTQSADLSLTKQTNGPGTADNTLPVTYTSFTYTLTVTNAGPDGTPGVVVNDPIPGFIPGRSTASVAGPAGWTCSVDGGGSLVCRSDATVLAGGASEVITVTVNGPLSDSALRPAGTCGAVAMPAGSWCNTAGVGVDPAVPGAIGEVDDSNNSASDFVRVPRVANVQTTAKTITTGTTGQVGVVSDSRIDYRNEGPSTVPAVVFRDVIGLPPNDSGFVLTSATRDGAGTTACTAVGGANVTSVPAPGGTRFHTEGSGAGEVTITCAPLDMASGQVNSLSVSLIPIFNLTGNPARAFPDTATFFFDRNGDGAADPSGGTDASGDFEFNTVATNADDVKSAALTFAAGAVDLITNKVDIGFAGGVDPMGYDPTDPSQNFVSYRVTVRNNAGPSVATGVSITDTIAPQAGATVRFDGASAVEGGPYDPSACTITSGANPVTGPATLTVTCVMPGAGFPVNQAGVINVNAESALYLRFEYLTPPSATGDTLTNTAASTANETDTQPGNNSEDENTSIRTRVDMAVSKTTVTQTPDLNPNVALPPIVDPVTVREPFFYVIEAVNNGPGSSLSLDRSGTNPLNGPGTRIVDTLPEGVIVTGTIQWQKVGPTVGVGDVPNGTGTCTLSGSTITCDMGDVTFAPGNSGRARIIVPARWDTVPAGGSSNNTATVSTQQVDNINSNDTVTVPLGVIASTISGTVFEDRDRTGANGGVPQDASAEPRIPGVTLTLAGTDVYGNAISLTTTTDASGNYSFGELSPSDASGYTVTQTQPTGFVNGPVDPPATGANAPSLSGTYARGAPNSSYAGIPVGRQDSGERYHFPELILASLSGFVYSDVDFSNTRTAGTDPGIAGATVELLDAATSAVLQTTTTDANGAYSFVNLDPLVAYTLREPLPAGDFNNAPLAVNPGLVSGAPCATGCTRGTAVGGDPLTTDRISDISLAVGNGQGTEFNFGENPQDTAISGRVWLDANNNGVIDTGETGFAGIAIRLTGLTENNVPVLRDTTTDAEGNYAFAGLVPGTYTVTEQAQPAGTFNGITVVGTLGGTATDLATTPSAISGIVTTAGVAGTGYNFGEIQPASIAGRVFYDFNNDGLFDGGETGIPGVTVNLSGTADTGAAVNTSATSDANGLYTFTDLRPGDYTLTEPTQPPGTTNGITTAGTINGTPSGTATPVATVPSAIANIALPAGGASVDNLFAEIADGEIAGRVWLDGNNNGVIDGGENGIANVQINLGGAIAGGGAVARTVNSGADGSWSFAGLPPGTYLVTEPTQPPGTLSGTTVAGTGGGTATAAGTTPSVIAGITLGISQQVDGYLFGEIPPGTISGRVYIDGNRNGVQDGVEVGIANVNITLSGADDLGQPVAATTVTGPLGAFEFINLRPGTYVLSEPDQPPSTTDGITVAGAVGGVSSGTPTPTGTLPSQISNIVLPSGESHVDNLFGEFPTGSLSGRVWLDSDNDGVIDTGETGIAEVLIELSGQTLTGQPFNLTDTTDAEGRYEFTGLPAGTYVVTEPNQPAGTVNGATVPGSSGGTATAPNTTPSQISGIVITLNENATDYNFGEAPGASIAGKVYVDENLNGVFDEGEMGIPNVAVVLNGNDDLGQAVNAPMSPLFNALAMRLVVNGTTTTDANGDYRFDTLRPGTYTVTEPEQPPLTTDGATNPGTINGVAVGVATPRGTLPSAISQTVLTPGAAATGANFGEIADSPDLRVTKSANPARFTVNNVGRYAIQVRNTGPKPTTGDYVVEDRLPPGMTLAAAPTGNGWTCTGGAGETAFSCTSAVVIARNETRADTIGVAVNVDESAAANSPVNNAVLVAGGGEDEVHLPTAEERAAFNGNVGALPVCDPAITQNACRVPTPVQLAAAVSGTVWFDAGSDDTFLDGGDRRLEGWRVELVVPASQQILAETTSATDGTYRIPNLIPGTRWFLRFRHPTSGVLWGYPVSGETPAGPPAPCDAAGAIERGTASTCRVVDQGVTELEVVLQAGAELPQQSLPVDPSGVVYDVVSRDPVPGSVVTLAPSGTCAGFDPATSILNGGAGGYTIEGSSISMTVDTNGFYQFLFGPAAPARCDYTLRVAPPGSFSFPSQVIPAEGGVLSPPGAVGTTFEVQRNATAPTAAVGPGTTYYLALSTGSGTANIVHNHIPLDPSTAPGLVITKTGDRQVVEIGDTLLYTITIRQTAGAPMDTVNVIDNLPPGFTYIDGTARADGAGIADPLGKPGPRLVFTTGPIAVGEQIVLNYRVRIGVGAMQGDGINRAQAYGCSITGGCVDPNTLQPLPGTVPSNRAQYRVRVTGGVFTDEGCVLGKIYVDTNHNQIQDHEELGIPGVRFYFEDGTWMTSDSEGKYSYCGLPPKSHTLKVDDSTLPVGSRLVTSSNRNLGDAESLFIDLKNGELHRADFIEGSGSNQVLEQVKARRTQGEVRAQENEIDRAPLSFQRQALGAPAQATDSARQNPIVSPRPTPIRDASATPMPAIIAPPAAAPPATDTAPATSELAPTDAEPEPMGAMIPTPTDTALDGLDNTTRATTSLTDSAAAPDAAPPSPAQVERFVPALGEPAALYPQTPNSSDPPTRAIDTQSGTVDYSANATVDAIALDLDRDGVPADGQSAVHVVVKLLGADGLPLAGGSFATIEYSGGRVKLPGARTDELGPGHLDADRVTPGIQLPIENGRAEFDLLAPDVPQDVLLRITAGDVSSESTVSFVPEMRELLATGLVEGVVNFRGDGNLIEPVHRDDAFERDIRRWEHQFNDGKATAAARTAFFVKGRIKGEYLLTAAYDSDKDVRGRLLRDIQPEEFYPVYGDASLRGFDARSAERAYVRIDKNRSYLLYGDFQSGETLATQTGVANRGRIMMRSLGTYNRTATGLGWHYENKRLSSNVFAIRDSLRQVIDEFPSQGSGPYGLSNNAVLEGSERVEVIVRDRNQPTRIINVRPLARLVDYSFEPFSGRILLNQFLPAFDTELNPVSLRVTYELDQGTEKFWVYGADAQLRITDRFEIGGSYVDDENEFAGFEMASANMGWRFGPKTWLVLEAARTRSEVNTNPINQYATPALQDLSGEVEGDAYRVEFGHDGEKLDVNVFAARTDPAFNNPAAPLYGGRGEYDAEVVWHIGKRFDLYAEVLRSEDRNPEGGERTAAGLGVRVDATKRLTLDFGLRSIEETIGRYSPWTMGAPFGSTGGLSGGFATGAGGGALGYGQQPLDPLTGLPVIRSDGTVPTSDLPIGTELESDTARIGAGYKINDKFIVGAEYEQEISGEDRERIAAGIDYRLRERNRLYGRYERQTGLTSAYGITTADRESDALVFGFDSTYLKDTQVFSEYRLRDAISGRDVQTASGIRDSWDIKEGLRLTGAAEHVRVYDGDTGDATALAFGLDYSANPLWRGAIRVEYRVSGDVGETPDIDEEFDTTLVQFLVARKLSRDWTFLARNYFLMTDYQARGDVMQDRFQLGVAFRDTDRNRVNALARYEYKIEEDNSGLAVTGAANPDAGQDVRTRAHILSTHADWHPSRPWWLTGRVAAKWQDDRFGFNDGTRVDDRFRGVLVSGRVVYDITENWDVGVLASTFRGDYDSDQYAYGVEVGRILRQNLWLSVGYNFVGFRGDPDLTGYEYTDEGAFIRLRFKFDEDLFIREDARYRAPDPK